MLKWLYIDNFRCLVNFELNLDSINLFLGSNGSGKSTVFKVLQKIQEFVNGDSKVKEIFLLSDCTRWQTLQVQHFELEIIGNNGIYKEAFCKPSVENLAKECRSHSLSENAPDSLRAACGELQRLLILLRSSNIIEVRSLIIDD